MADGDYGLGAMTGVIPTILVAGVATKMTGGLFGKTTQPSDQWQPVTKKEAYDLIGRKKVSMLQKSPGKVFTWGYDKFKFENGQFFLA